MKLIIFMLILILLNSCSMNDNTGVYWCGDHPCINKKEKEAYFKKNMIVEKRNLKKEKSKNKNNLEKIIEQAKIKEKKRIISEKESLKEAKLREKQKLKNEKKMLKEAKIREKKLLKEEMSLEKELEKKIKNDEKNTSKNINDNDKVVSVDLGIISADVNVSNFKKMKEKIISKNSNKSYPDINNIPN